MESGLRALFLIILVISLSGCAATRNLFGVGDEEPPPPTAEPTGQVIEPQVERREVEETGIDRNNIEIGAYAGIMSIEDFGSNVSYGVRLAYHVTEGFFVEATAGQSEGGSTGVEELSGNANVVADGERTLTYYNLNFGYKILPGEVFLGDGRSFKTNMYLIAGLGSTSFGGDDRLTVNVGAGYRFLLKDSIALHLDFRDHLFNSDFFEENKTTHNLEAHLGLTYFF